MANTTKVRVKSRLNLLNPVFIALKRVSIRLLLMLKETISEHLGISESEEEKVVDEKEIDKRNSWECS